MCSLQHFVNSPKVSAIITSSDVVRPIELVPKKKGGVKQSLPHNVVCCVNTLGCERYGVKMLFETRQIRVGSRFIDPSSAAHVANNFRAVVRINSEGRFYIDESSVAGVAKKSGAVVKYYKKFSQSVIA